jgi:hypothetical protein
MVSLTDGVYCRTTLGEATVVSESRDKKQSALAVCEAIAAVLRAPPHNCVAFEPAAISEVEAQAAYQLYKASFDKHAGQEERTSDA